MDLEFRPPPMEERFREGAPYDPRDRPVVERIPGDPRSQPPPVDRGDARMRMEEPRGPPRGNYLRHLSISVRSLLT